MSATGPNSTSKRPTPRGIAAVGAWIALPFVLVGLALTLFLALLTLVKISDVLTGASFGPDESAIVRNLTFLLAAVIGAPFVIWRALIAQKQADAAAEQTRIATEANVTRRITEAVEQLGAERTVKVIEETPRYRTRPNAAQDDAARDEDRWARDADGEPVPALRPDGTPIIDREILERSEPNLEVRLGGLYALERISQDSPRDHRRVMEIVCAYLRENSVGYEKPADDPGAPERLPCRVDVAAALTILSRRSDKRRAQEREGPAPYSPDLSRIDLRGRVGPDWLRLEGVDFSEARLQNADLSGARLQGADFRLAALDGADFSGAELQGALLWHARAAGTLFTDATMTGCCLKGTDLLGAVGLSDATLAGAFGDGSVKLTNGPDLAAFGWPDATLTEYAFLSRWRHRRESAGLEWPPAGEALSREILVGLKWVKVQDIEPVAHDSPVRPDEIHR